MRAPARRGRRLYPQVYPFYGCGWWKGEASEASEASKAKSTTLTMEKPQVSKADADTPDRSKEGAQTKQAGAVAPRDRHYSRFTD